MNYSEIIAADDMLLLTLFEQEAEEGDILHPSHICIPCGERGGAAWMIDPDGEIHPVEDHSQGALRFYGIQRGEAMAKLGVVMAWEGEGMEMQKGKLVKVPSTLYFTRINPLSPAQVQALKWLKDTCGLERLLYTR